MEWENGKIEIFGKVKISTILNHLPNKTNTKAFPHNTNLAPGYRGAISHR